MATENHFQSFDETALPDHVISIAKANTLDGLFRARVKATPDKEAYRFFNHTAQQWQSLNWREVADRVHKMQAALSKHRFQTGDRVAIMMANSIYWPVFDQAALGLGLVTVPLYSNDRPDNSAYVLNDSGARLLFIMNQEQALKLESVADQLNEDLIIVSVEPVKTKKLSIQPLEDWLEETAEIITGTHSAKDLASIVYTSGTTGLCKGVMLSHKNLLWNAWAGLHMIVVPPDARHLSFLPLSHTFERTIGYYLMMMVGASVAFNRSIPELSEDLQIIKPTLLVTVPSVFVRVHSKVLEKLQLQPVFMQKLFNMAVALGWQKFLISQGKAKWTAKMLLHPLLDKLVGAKIRARFGGCIDIAVVGGAPMPEKIAQTFIGLGVPLYQGYGLTETSPVISVNTKEHNEPTSVGRLLPNVEIRIDANTDELIVKSPGVMQGYWNNSVATKAVLEETGWLHTGDIARYEDHMLYITDRIKDILVLANGEKVSPSDIESALVAEPLIEQSMVIGEGRPYLTALIVVNEAEKNRLFEQQDHEEQSAMLQQRVQQSIDASLKHFPGYAQIRNFAIFDKEWTLEDAFLTPTLKIRRDKIMQHFQAQIDALY